MALFTSENAAEMGARSQALRKQRLEELRLAANPVPLPADNSYSERRLSRVRNQIESLSDMLDKEDDAQKLDRLASAIARLSEIERQLAGRPLPGSRRPREEPADPGPSAMPPLPQGV